MKAWSGIVLAIAVALGSSSAQAGRAEFDTARRIFFASETKQHFEIPMLLIASGQYNAMSDGSFGPRLFKAIQQFQASIGADETGWLTTDQLARLRVVGYGAMTTWGMVEVVHPYTNAKLYVPKRVAGRQDYTKRGYSFEAYDRSLSVDFSFFSSSETSLEELYLRLGTASGARRIDYKVIRPSFFAIAGGIGPRGFYTKYQISRGGVVGFTTSWDTSRVDRGERIGTLMANLFFVPLEGSAEPDTSQVALPPQSAPVAPPVTPAPPPAVADVKPAPSGGSGTGFFVTAKRMLTNAHVVDGCDTVSLTIGQTKASGRVLARDKTNDLALVEAEVTSEATAKLRSGVRLGEDVAAFGYPLNGFLATSGNFTRGGVTATVGLKDNTAELQISAPVQPGNSGGPLLDESGNVIGIVASKLKVLQVAMLTGDFAQNVNFAIKSSVAQTFLESNNTQFEVGAAGEAMKSPDLAAKAQSFSAIIVCKP